jgi:hypothetical protein
MENKTIKWLLDGDVSIRYQAYRDLMDIDKPRLRSKIATEGWGRKFLSARHPDGHWGRGFYQPKWTSTHYTLLDLKNLNIAPDLEVIASSLDAVFNLRKGADGGIFPIGTPWVSEVCINGMFLNYASYFKVGEALLKSVVDFLLSQQMSDGGFNCFSNRKGAVHSSLHTTISVLEGFREYEKNGHTYRLKEIQKAVSDAQEFILIHRLYRSDKTGEIINKSFLRFCYPCRWHYDILRAMDYFHFAKREYDPRMTEAIQLIIEKRTIDGQWKLPAPYPGQTHFEMEQAGTPGRWNTLRAMRVLKYYNADG